MRDLGLIRSFYTNHRERAVTKRLIASRIGRPPRSQRMDRQRDRVRREPVDVRPRVDHDFRTESYRRVGLRER